jgi:hypothetical protein
MTGSETAARERDGAGSRRCTHRHERRVFHQDDVPRISPKRATATTLKWRPIAHLLRSCNDRAMLRASPNRVKQNRLAPRALVEESVRCGERRQSAERRHDSEPDPPHGHLVRMAGGSLAERPDGHQQGGQFTRVPCWWWHGDERVSTRLPPGQRAETAAAWGRACRDHERDKPSFSIAVQRARVAPGGRAGTA